MDNFEALPYFHKIKDENWFRGNDSAGNLYFATDNDLEKLVLQKEFFFDSTFSPVARIAQFHQLSILSVYEELPNGAYFSNPLVFVLNKNKKTENYRLIFDHIKSLTITTGNLGQNFSPTLIHVDFELSQKNGTQR